MNYPHMATISDAVGTKLDLRSRRATFDDYAEIAALASRYLLEPETREEWVHLWANNPAYHQLPDWPIGWVFENEDKRIVAYIGNVPLLYELRGQRLTVTASRAFVVDIPYRSYSFPLLNHFFKQKQVDLFLDTTVNAEASKAHEVFRALRVPIGTWNEAAFWITNYRGFSACLLAMKEFTAARGLSYPLSVGLFLRDRIEGRSWKTRCNGAEASFCNRFDERFDDFWQQLRRNYPGRLLANRSREVLEWHFKRPLENGKAWVLTVSKGSALAAYAVFFRQDNTASSLKRMRLVDFQMLGDNTELLRPLICQALARCRSEGIHMLECIGFARDKQRVIEALAPHGRKLSSWRYFYKATNRQLAETLKDPQVWDPSCFDGDASL
jgi:hypothetical protein